MAKKRKTSKAKKRAIANRNLRKARKARWKGHKKAVKKLLTKAQRRAVALRNLKKAHAARRGKRRGRRKGKR